MAKNKSATRYYSDLQESYVAKLLNGHTTSNSGAGAFTAGDVLVPEASLLVECKCCMSEKNSFSIKKEWIDKSNRESKDFRFDNACLCFNFGPGTENHFVISEKLMRYLVENLKKEN